MMLEKGQVYEKNGYSFCVLDLIDYNMKKYVLFSVEKEKIEYVFYEINSSVSGYNLIKVSDNALEYALFDIIERKGE